MVWKKNWFSYLQDILMTPCHDIAVIKSLQWIFVGKKKSKNVSEFYQFSCFLTSVFQVKIWFQVETLFKNLPK